jgi:hypothetical protein
MRLPKDIKERNANLTRSQAHRPAALSSWSPEYPPMAPPMAPPIAAPNPGIKNAPIKAPIPAPVAARVKVADSRLRIGFRGSCRLICGIKPPFIELQNHPRFTVRDYVF